MMITTAKLSKEFLIRLKLNWEPQYRICQKAGVHPDSLSKLLNGQMTIREDDPRIIAVGRILGLDPDECFNDEDKEGSE